MKSLKPDKENVTGLLAWFADNHVAANLLMVMIMLSGGITILNSTIEIFPEIDPHTITIIVPYPGSTPDEVEESINRRIEEAVTGIEGVEKIRSTAAEGAGTVTVELSDDSNDRDVLDDVKSAVEQIQNFPPEDAEVLLPGSGAHPIRGRHARRSSVVLARFRAMSRRGSSHELPR